MRVTFGKVLQEAAGGSKLLKARLHDEFSTITVVVPPKQYTGEVPFKRLEEAAREVEKDARQVAKMLGGRLDTNKDQPAVTHGSYGQKGFLISVFGQVKYKSKDNGELKGDAEALGDWARKQGYSADVMVLP